MRRYFIYKCLAFATMGAMAVGCINENTKSLLFSNYLSVSVYEEPIGNRKSPDADSRDTRSSAVVEKADTVWLDKDVYVTARVEDMLADSLPATRGTLVESLTIPSMSLVMFNTQRNAYSDTSTATQVIEADRSDDSFQLEPAYSWAESSTDLHTFLAFSPKVSATNGLAFTSDKKSITYTIPADVTQQPDICVSDYTQNKDQENTIGSNTHNQKFAMRHMLTAVGFEAAGWDMRINEVKITNAYNQGTISLENRVWTFGNDYSEYTAGTDPMWLQSTGRTDRTNITKANGYLMMIPQPIDETMELIFTSEGRNEQAGTGKTYYVPLKDLGVEWTPGKRVIYQLRLKTRPAVLADDVLIPSFTAGLTSSIPLAINASDDDDLTFTWTAPWLKMYRGAPGNVNISSGYTSGWKTGVNNWKSLYFFATTENSSAIAPRKAVVTVVGKKSGIRTFKVTQSQRDFQIEGSTATINNFKQGTANAPLSFWLTNGVSIANSTITVKVVKAQGPGGSNQDKNWLSNPVRGNIVNDRQSVSFAHNWNINARIQRTATVEVTAQHGGITRKRQFTITQNASNFWIMLNGNNTFRMGIHATNLGNYFGKEEYRCSNAKQGTRLMRVNDDEHKTIQYWVLNNWANKANFKIGWYWTSTHHSDVFWTGRASAVTFGSHSPNKFVNAGVFLRTTNHAYRCLYDEEKYIY